MKIRRFLVPVTPVSLLYLAACFGTLGGASVGGGPSGDEPSPLNPGGANSLSTETIKGYEMAGLIAEGGLFPFVGNVSYFGTPTVDSTMVLLTTSFSNRALTFIRDGDQFRAEYETRVNITSPDGQMIAHTEGSQLVRVASYAETGRTTESVIFQANLKVPPGKYQLSLYMHDMGSVRAVTRDIPVVVPKLDSTSLSSPIAVYQATPRASADSTPRLVVSPRSSVVYGRDSVISVYIEGYGSGDSLPVEVAIREDAMRGDSSQNLWQENVTLPRHGAMFSGVAEVPVSRVGVGAASLVFRRGADTVHTPVFVSFGEDLPVTSYDDMLSYLKYYPNQAAVDSLHAAPHALRAVAWGQFRHVADSIGSLSPVQSLANYFTRLRQANDRYQGEGIPGWETDRGMVFITVGDPEQVFMQGGSITGAPGHEQVWVYRRYNTQLTFDDQSGQAKFKLTLRSQGAYQSLRRRVLEDLQRGMAPASSSSSGQH